MYECPGCGGNLKFDIASQMLLCPNCDSKYDPNSVEKDTDAVTQAYYDANIFVCPQCGGEILSTENSITEFCSYCGAATILSPRITKAKRPDYLIPFKVTKEDCKKEYKKYLRHAIFAPREYKTGGRIDSFRGIYIPYYSYNIKQENYLCIPAERSYRRGDYDITDYYNLQGSLSGFYNGVAYDASSAFDDEISASIAPFEIKEKKAFTPAYLSGFYADLSDVPEDLYVEYAEGFANESTENKIRKVKEYGVAGTPKFPISVEKENTLFGTNCTKIDSALFPVWFMSYRNKDRVAYSVVNGQTGRVTADIPASIPKYIIGSLICAIPIILLLNSFLTVLPTTILTIAGILGIIMEGIYTSEIKKVIARDNHTDDLGYQAAHGNRKVKKPTTKKKQAVKGGSIVFGIIIGVYVLAQIAPFIIAVLSLTKLVAFGLTLISLIIMCVSLKNYKALTHKGFPAAIAITCVSAISTILQFASPVSDIPYYVAAIVMMLVMFFTAITNINQFNILATRRLPQFDKKGGDDRA